MVFQASITFYVIFHQLKVVDCYISYYLKVGESILLSLRNDGISSQSLPCPQISGAVPFSIFELK